MYKKTQERVLPTVSPPASKKSRQMPMRSSLVRPESELCISFRYASTKSWIEMHFYSIWQEAIKKEILDKAQWTIMDNSSRRTEYQCKGEDNYNKPSELYRCQILLHAHRSLCEIVPWECCRTSLHAQNYKSPKKLPNSWWGGKGCILSRSQNSAGGLSPGC